MPFKLTFNKPAVRQFIEGEETGGLRIKIEDGMVQFMPSSEKGDDTAPLDKRTRGGFESIIEGERADDVLKALHNPHGPFFVLKRMSKDWVAAVPYKGKNAPPKFEPHVRVWAADVPKVSKTTGKAKKAVARKVRETFEPKMAPMDRVRWAYDKLSEKRGSGRPSLDVMEARAIKESFEREALSFVAQQPNTVDLSSLVEAYHKIGDYLRQQAPESIAV